MHVLKFIDDIARSGFANRIRKSLLTLDPAHKRAVVYVNDFLLSSVALWAAFSMRLGIIFVPDSPREWLLFLAAPVLAVASLHYAGAYRRIARFTGNTSSRRVMTGVLLGVLLWILLVFVLQVNLRSEYGVPRSVVFIYWAFFFLFLWVNRELASWFLSSVAPRFVNGKVEEPETEKNVLIWGYGNTALQLAHDLRQLRGYRLIGIVDADSTLWYRKADAVKIYPPEQLANLINRERVREIFLDNKIVSREQRLAIIRDFSSYPVAFRLLPSIEDITAGTISIDSIRQIKVEDLLGREPIPPIGELLDASVRGKSVMVTGAGGSIGSELVRQIVRLKPSRLVLVEMSEAALYEIDAEVNDILKRMKRAVADAELPHIEALIGSVLDEASMRRVIAGNDVRIIFHAAAYKHVPIVEQNPIAGLENNTFGTWSLARAARDCGVERFILISTDKAVRPTNIMGASKRLAEKILQALAAEPECRTRFCMVRFGNVLDSSGSVVPLFREQIRNGGPVTVTHPDITRYFMLVSEAVELVIQAGAMAEQGAIYVLDMGEPVRIADLARTMINLGGRSVRDEHNPEGDIAIEYVGLRPGEKLYEELLLSGNKEPTRHERIYVLQEPLNPLTELTRDLAYLEALMRDRDIDGIKQLLGEIVESY